jgi:putative membrane protein
MHAKKLTVAAGLTAALLATAAYAKEMTPQEFVTTASIANKFEIDTSKLALQKSQRSDVKEFAQKMIDDHTAAGEKMKEAIADSSSKPTPADKLDTKHQALYDKLDKAPSVAFDKEYVTAQEDAHKDAVKLFGNYSKNGSDPSIKDFAAKTLPTLKMHKEHVDKL